jgi:hypothetical protein
MTFRSKLAPRLAAVVLALGFAAPALAAAPTAHEHGAAPATLSLNAGKKWPTDAPLRQAMGNIRAAMDASLHPIHEGRFGAAKYGALARKIDGEVGYMVANCRLEPKADAQLHLIVARLVEGAEVMAGKAKGTKRVDGAVKVLGALENYGNYFDDPSWKPIAH